MDSIKFSCLHDFQPQRAGFKKLIVLIEIILRLRLIAHK